MNKEVLLAIFKIAQFFDVIFAACIPEISVYWGVVGWLITCPGRPSPSPYLWRGSPGRGITLVLVVITLHKRLWGCSPRMVRLKGLLHKGSNTGLSVPLTCCSHTTNKVMPFKHIVFITFIYFLWGAQTKERILIWSQEFATWHTVTITVMRNFTCQRQNFYYKKRIFHMALIPPLNYGWQWMLRLVLMKACHWSTLFIMLI